MAVNSVNMANATNTSVTVTNVQSTNGGTYRVVVTNLYGSITSSNAVLTVLTSAVQVVSASAGGSTTVTVPIQLVSAGNENALNFSINFSNAVLTYSSAAVGSNAGSAFLFANASQAGSGRLGLELELASGSFSIGTQQVAVVNFAVANVTNTFVTTITFGTQPTAELVLNAQSATLPATYSAGNVSIAATAWEGDVSPRTNGDGFVAINDWLQEGRFVAGLDTANNGKEFQRADTAPRATQGDGQINGGHWVQVGRYAAGLDALETIGGPSAPNFHKFKCCVRHSNHQPDAFVAKPDDEFHRRANDRARERKCGWLQRCVRSGAGQFTQRQPRQRRVRSSHGRQHEPSRERQPGDCFGVDPRQ